MRVMAFNGSPRKHWNTAQLIERALEGAAFRGADTEIVHLYDLNFKGCISCFACKTLDGESYGRCAVTDDLTPLLDRVKGADALILGSPIYYWSLSGEMKCFLERLLFPYYTYTEPAGSLFPGRLAVGWIYTMNITADRYAASVLPGHLAQYEGLTRQIFGSAEVLLSFDTCQFPDYAKVEASRFDGNAKARRRRELFPLDGEKARDMGARLVA